MIKNDPYKLLEQEKIAKNLLGEKALKALSLFDRSKKIHEEFPKDATIASQAEKMGELAIAQVKTEIEKLKKDLVDEQEQAAQHEVRKAQSKKILHKSEKVIDDLSICRERLREDRRKKIESGEIAAPKKKTLTTKLKDDMAKVAALIPEKLKGDPDIIKRTEKAVINFLNELKKIWGLNKIKSIEVEIKEKFNKLLHQA